MNRTYFKFLLLGILCGILNCSYLWISNDNSISLSGMINLFGFNDFYINAGYLILLFRWYFPIILFQIIWGTYIYRHFCSASVYYFSRCNNRVKWFLKEIVYLYIYAILYLLSSLVISALVILFCGNLTLDSSAFLLALYYLILHSLWLFIITVLINVLSITIGSVAGFSIVAAIQALGVAIFIILDDLNIFTYELTSPDEIENLELQSKIIKFDPISHIVLKYHNSGNSKLNSVINKYGFDFSLNESVLTLFIAALIVLAVGCIIIKKKEFITINKESEA